MNIEWTEKVAKLVSQQEWELAGVPDEEIGDDLYIEAFQHLADLGYMDDEIMVLAEKGYVHINGYDPDKAYYPKHHHPEVL